MDLEIRHLRLVKAVSDAGSISAAAPVLGATQPAVTRQLRRIENGIGGRLFTRSRDGVEPTELGRFVVGRADAVLAIMDSLQTDISASLSTEVPQVARIGARTGPLLLAMMRGLRDLVPGIEVVPESEGRLGALLDLMAAGPVDLALVREFVGFELPLDPRLHSVPVMVENVSLVMSDNHPLAHKDEVGVEELADQKWLLSPLDVDREADSVSAMCAEAGFTPQIVHYVTDTMAFDLIRAGEAISPSLPRRPPRGTSYVTIRGNPLKLRHVLVTTKQGAFMPYVDRLVGYARESLLEAQGRLA